VATTADARLRAGQVILAMGNHEGLFALTWHSVQRPKAAHLSTCKAMSSG
jgi:hypothetical protein